MKKRIVIIEDNFYKYFTIKSLLESQLHLTSETMEINNLDELDKVVTDLSPDSLMYRQNDSSLEIISTLRKKGANRRNTEIIFIVAEELEMIFPHGLAPA